MDDFLDSLDIGDVISGVVKVGGTLFGADSAKDSVNAANEEYSESVQQSADRLLGGYDEQQFNLEQGFEALQRLQDAGLTDVTSLLNYGADKYAGDVQTAPVNYANYMFPQVAEYGNELNATADQAINTLQDGSEAFIGEYQPYQMSGEQALQYMQQIMGQDPSQMDAAQRRVYDDAKRNMLATLASSQLRGAGRAGIAAVNEGEAALQAQFLSENRDRQDAAAAALMDKGWGATGQIATNRQNLADSTADLKFKVGSEVAGQGLSLASDVGNKQFSAANDAASTRLGATNSITNATSDYYGNTSNIQGGKYQARGDTALAKANVDAAAGGTIGAQNYKDALTNANIDQNTTNSVIGTLSNTFNGEQKKQTDVF